MLVALVFVLARNIIKLVVERRRALPFARFRAKLVAVLLGLTLIPSILVLLVGSELIRNSADRWFNAPMDEMLSSANRIASDYYAERQRSVRRARRRGSRASWRRRTSPRPTSRHCRIAIGRAVAAGPREARRGLPRHAGGRRRRASLRRCWTSPRHRFRPARRVPRRNAWPARVAAGAAETWVLEPLAAGGELLRGASPDQGPERAGCRASSSPATI